MPTRNAGSGNNRLDTDMTTNTPNLYIIRYGINDGVSRFYDDGTTTQEKLNNFKKNMIEGLSRIRGNVPVNGRNSYNKTVNDMSIILCSSNSVDLGNVDGRTLEFCKGVRDIMLELSKIYQCCFVDIFNWTLNSNFNGWSTNEDKLHPNEVANINIANVFDSVLMPSPLRKFNIPQSGKLTLLNLTSYANLKPSIGDFTNNIPFAMEFKLKLVDNNSKAIIGKKDSSYVSAPVTKGWVIRTQASGKIVLDGCLSNGSSNSLLVSTSALSKNTIYFIRIVCDGSTIRLYISTDGVEYNEDALTVASGSIANVISSFNNADDFETTIGRMFNGNSGWGNYFYGDIYSIKIWKKTTDFTRLPTNSYQMINHGVNTILTDVMNGDNGLVYGGGIQQI